MLSDDAGASKRIDDFSGSQDRWMVAVRMVSEGVDVPRLAVGVYATTISTPLFFAQAVGRFVRSRRRGETASVFLPTIPMLLGFAGEMEVERDHVLDQPKKSGEEDPYAEEDKLLAEAEREQDEVTEDQLPFEALESDAVFDRVLYDGAEFGMQAHPGSEEEQDYLGIPGLLEPDQVQMLLQRRQARQIAHSRRRPDAEADLVELPAERRPVVTHKEMLELRKRAQHDGGRLHPPVRQAARRHPQRAAPPVRRPAQRRGHRGTAPGAHQEGPGVGHPDALTGPERRFPAVLFAYGRHRRAGKGLRPDGGSCLPLSGTASLLSPTRGRRGSAAAEEPGAHSAMAEPRHSY